MPGLKLIKVSQVATTGGYSLNVGENNREHNDQIAPNKAFTCNIERDMLKCI